MIREEFDKIEEETARALGSAVAEVTRLGLLPELEPFKKAIQDACERLEEVAEDLANTHKEQRAQIEQSVVRFAESLRGTARELETGQQQSTEAFQKLLLSERDFVAHIEKVNDEIMKLDEGVGALGQTQRTQFEQTKSEIGALDQRVGIVAAGQDALLAKEIPSLMSRIHELNQMTTRIQGEVADLGLAAQSIVGMQEKLALTGQVKEATERITRGQGRIVTFSLAAMIISALALFGVLALVAFDLLR